MLCICLIAAGCTAFVPRETERERARLEEAEEPFAASHATRELPPLADDASIDAVLAYAFRSNAELEVAYFEWAAALARVPQAASLPDPGFSFDYLFSDEKMSRWDRSTLGASQMIPHPGKLTRAARIALDEAVAARRRLEARKFALQADVVAGWLELWRVERSAEIDEQNLALLQQFAVLTRELVAVGRAPQADASKADLEVASAQNRLLTRRAERPAALAALNALLSRSAAAPLRSTVTAPEVRLPEDAVLVSLAAERNPELEALAAQVRGRESAVELARLSYVPDLQIGVDVRGSMDRMLTAMITLPLQLPRIQAGIEEARASLRAAQAALRARGDQIGAQLALELFLARDSERQLALFREVLIPRARDVVSATEMVYATGGASFLELLDAQRSLLALELDTLELRAIRGTAAAALEALCAIDFETVEP
jgi:outer membrane protein TolC